MTMLTRVSELAKENDKAEYGKCPICGNNLNFRSDDGEFEHINCPSCGLFRIPLVFRCVEDIDKSIFLNHKYLIAGYLFETKNTREDFLRVGQSYVEANITPETIEKILKSSRIPKTSIEKLERFILNLYRTGKEFTISFNLVTYGKRDIFPAIGYAKNDSEIKAMADALCDLGWFSHPTDGLNYTITINGLEKAESLLKSNVNSKKVFIAMPFSDYPDYNYKWTDIRDSAIKPAANDCGFDAHTVNESQHIGNIPDRMIAEIKRSRFVIADFTKNNLGVYYEAGYAKGLGIPVIKTCKKEWFDKKDENGSKVNKLHFDIEQDNLILWESIDDLRQKLKDRINALF